MYIYLIMRSKICLEMEHVRCLPNYVYIYLFICLPNYMCVYLIKEWKICLEMEQVCLPIYMYVYLIRRWKNCLEVPGFSAHVEGGSTTGLLANFIGTGKKRCSNSCTCRYASSCVYKMCTYTVYLMQGTLEVPQC